MYALRLLPVSLFALLLASCAAPRSLTGRAVVESAGVVVRRVPLVAEWPRFDPEAGPVVVRSGADTLAVGRFEGRTSVFGESLDGALALDWRLAPYGLSGTRPVRVALLHPPGTDVYLASGDALLHEGEEVLDVPLPGFSTGPDVRRAERARWELRYWFENDGGP